MSQPSLLSRVFSRSRIRRTRRRVKSLSEVVGRLADASPAEFPPSAQPEPYPTADGAGQLEAENAHLKRMAGDLMLQTEILRATMRRGCAKTA